jgi:hypothetical protein
MENFRWMSTLISHVYPSWITIDSSIPAGIPRISRSDIAAELTTRPFTVNDYQTVGILVCAYRIRNQHWRMLKPLIRLTRGGKSGERSRPFTFLRMTVVCLQRVFSWTTRPSSVHRDSSLMTAKKDRCKEEALDNVRRIGYFQSHRTMNAEMP